VGQVDGLPHGLSGRHSEVVTAVAFPPIRSYDDHMARWVSRMTTGRTARRLPLRSPSRSQEPREAWKGTVDAGLNGALTMMRTQP
jgi:hypothetical protein